MSHKKTIMMVDDDKKFLEQFGEMLTLRGYDTALHTDGDEALSEVAGRKPDLILLDLKMDGKSGFEITEILSNDPSTAAIPVMVISAYFHERDVEALTAKLSVEKCISKPINLLSVISDIETYLDRGSVRKEVDHDIGP